ncbi:hypothetical protein [Streptomyces mangrovisoli]|uniref:Uncharacterized protein n=1 Tax=Streptomyces mangrovisoli TaxID=1428628 RepID=A0A1J4NKJ5_9ACTN|nr:hypothetical protein [Streptomyces mangrovisoli]OIJ62776.1 hypothetical protein WN71_037855 [Streptomyces mangrovisoli]
MSTPVANGDTRLTRWLRVREFAVPPSMIETATARRTVGDWAGACAAARLDVDLDLRTVARTWGRDLAGRIRADLRRLAPDLLRWHLPRIAPDGLLRPELTIALARYDIEGDRTRPVHLVVRTPPAWADGGQRVSLTVRDGSRSTPADRAHPHPNPSRRFRLDLHRHLWDAGRAHELRLRAGDFDPNAGIPDGEPCPAVDRWAEEALILLRAEASAEGPSRERERGRAPACGPTGARRVAVRLSRRDRLILELHPGDHDMSPAGHPGVPPALTITRADGMPDGLPVLPDAATWLPPDLELLAAGLIEPGRLHPLVAAALAPGHVAELPPAAGESDPYLVECQGALHRIGLVDGVLSAPDHHPDEIRREELLRAFGGPQLPCLAAVDRALRAPHCLPDVRERLRHGDVTGALDAVERLLGPDAVLRDGPLREELVAAAERRVIHGLFRAGLTYSDARRVRLPAPRRRARTLAQVPRSRPRHAMAR